ncbi:PepSY-associated TM helix domain-containing protein [Janthinobacterium agaricidamnosum]|uniref:PepSY-associated TM helix family protein n=1 Tax=Janthinobacterium agaricidamnosum NBRC 102515 = DSM 9628 TaxID=1349767 RepID=W0V320_9BURK|nr:PepSY-associated TM helix domain-containing protein [Janthinobacterium agaricidamnosum]CDG83234.1 pepSY-associated TM helix family protein [Janthinobacterium agaricidamnosum NBRC 102515 = DSM 9628]
MTPITIRRWAWVHKWSSLVCTIFMLLLCLTGLPLIFHHQIDEWLGNEIEAPEMARDTPKADVDQVIAAGRALYPKLVMQYMSQEIGNDKIWNLTLGKTPLDPDFKSIAVDARSARLLDERKFEGTFMYIMLRLHVDLFAGLWGMLFLGLMGLLLIIAIISGVVLYAPFMRKLDFGTVRRERTSRVKWLDLHNLLGIVTLVWALVVGATGMINTWADLVLKYWQHDQLAEMVAPYKNLPPPTTLGPMQAALDAAHKLEPDMNVAFIAWPGTAFSSPHHYGVFMRGREALTSRLYKPVLVDARTSLVTDSRTLPWYLTGLLISQPLHFGDYGGLWMQIWWALLDIATIVVLGSGLYLWLRRGVKANNETRGDVAEPAAEAA